MAASRQSLVEDLNDTFLQCSICMETYKSPRMLPCIHSFCLQCLEKLMACSHKDQPFSCPTCRRVVAIPLNGLKDLPTNFLLVSLMERLNIESTTTGSVSTACHFCEGTLNIHICLDCSLHVCSTCRKFHDRIPDCRDHTLIPVEKLHDEEYTKGVLASQAPRCTEHPKEKLRFYCTSCSKLVCRDCAIVSHQGHKCVEAEKNVAMVREGLTSALTESGQRVKFVHGISTGINSYMQKIDDFANEEKRKVKEYYDKLIERMTSDKNKLMETIEKIRSEQKNPLKDFLDDLTNWEKAMKNSQAVTTKVLETNNQWDILAMGNDIKDAMKSLHNEKCKFNEKITELKKGTISGIRFKTGENAEQESLLKGNMLGVIEQLPVPSTKQQVPSQNYPQLQSSPLPSPTRSLNPNQNVISTSGQVVPTPLTQMRTTIYSHIPVTQNETGAYVQRSRNVYPPKY